jgi:hypothetical protein
MRTDEQGARETLDRELDRIAGDIDPPMTGVRLAPDLAETLRRVRVLAAREEPPQPDAAFVRRLEESLMHPARPNRLPLPRARWSSMRTRFPPTSIPSPSLGGRLVGVGATIALLLVTLTIGGLALRQSGSDRGVPTASLTAQGAPTVPPSDERWACTRPDPFEACAMSMSSVGDAELDVRRIDTRAVDVRRVQLQDWDVPAGVVVRPDSASWSFVGATGVIVDFVMDGAYTATFDADVTVLRSPNAGFGSFVYDDVPAGTAVELVKGEAIAYPLGAQQSLRNPMSRTALHFKRALFTDDDAAFIHSAADATPTGGPVVKRVIGMEGWQVSVDGDGVLPQTLGTLVPDQISFTLAYVRVPEGAVFPPSSWHRTVAIGPVAPVPWEGSGTMTEGYVLLVSEPKG